MVTVPHLVDIVSLEGMLGLRVRKHRASVRGRVLCQLFKERG
jgi:hypothetical protein